MHWRRKWQPTPVFLPGESQGRGAWWAAISGVTQSRTRLKQLSSSSSTVIPMLLFKDLPYITPSAQKNIQLHLSQTWIGLISIAYLAGIYSSPKAAQWGFKYGRDK